MKRLLLLLLFALPLSGEPIRVLFIGNSLTYWNEMPWLTERVAESLDAKTPLDAEFNGLSGATLRRQWERGRALNAIREQRWDFVVLQAQSTEILANPEETTKYARLFSDEIKKARAKTVIFLTWIPLDAKGTQKEMTARYLKLARELGASVAPVGIAWERLLKRGIALFDGSRLHPNLNGSYLTACVFFATIYRRSPAGATHRFETNFTIDEFYRRDLVNERIEWATAEAIQRAAWEAVSSPHD